MSLRKVFDSGPTAGGWCVIGSPYSAEVMAHAGFDWICIDTQHGLVGYADMLGMLLAASSAQTPALVRVRWNEPQLIMAALDAGAHGVIVPMVNSREEAEFAVMATRFPPLGTRSWGPSRAVWNHDPYSAAAANDDVVCLVQVETRQAVEALDEILLVPGVDGVYVGPADLALSYGLAPAIRIDDMEHTQIIRDILERCLAAGKYCAIHADDPVTARAWLALGFHHVTLASDASLIAKNARASLTALADSALGS